MEEEKIAQMMAGQTAIQAVLINILIAQDILDRDKLVRTLYELLDKAQKENSLGSIPVKHLISILEHMTFV